MTNSKIKVVLADDHQIVLDGLKTLLNQEHQICIVETFNNGSETVQYCSRNQVDIVLLDINMPILDGIDACETISALRGTKIIALTNHQELAFIYRMLNAGANGYLLKTVDKPTLIRAIETVHRGGTYYCSHVRNALISMDSTHMSQKREVLPSLSRREKEILRLIINENTTKEIAHHLYIGQCTVDTHRKNLLRKLNVRNTAGLVRLAYERNLLVS